jgi:hypothetical protein
MKPRVRAFSFPFPRHHSSSSTTAPIPPSISLIYLVISLIPSFTHHSFPRTAPTDQPQPDHQRSTTNTGLRTITKSETAPSSPVSKPDGMTLLQSSSPITRSLTIWITGLNRGLVRRKYRRELGSGNMDSKRVSSVASELEVSSL